MTSTGASRTAFKSWSTSMTLSTACANSSFATITVSGSPSVNPSTRRCSPAAAHANPKASFFRLALLALADPENVPVRMPHVHLADVPRHVGRRESDVQPGGHALSVHLVNVLHPHRHPHAL